MRTLLCTALLLAGGCGHRPDTVPEREVDAPAEEGPAYTLHRLTPAELDSFAHSPRGADADTAGIRAFYAGRDLQYAWFIDGSLTSAADNFLLLVSSSEHTGAAAVERDSLQALIRRSSVERDTSSAWMREVELALTAHFFRFAGRQYGGLVQRDPLELDWFIPRRKKDVTHLLKALLEGRTDLSPLEPLHPLYLALRKQLIRLDALRWLDTLPHLHDLPMPAAGLAPGDTDSLVVHVRQRLAAWGDLPQGDQVAGTTLYDTTLAAAVARFQIRHGLRADRLIDQGLVNALDRPVEERIRTVLLNMERLRWLPERPAPDMLFVNIPDFRLHVLEGDRVTWGMDVVVGSEATGTAVFAGAITHIVFSPAWTVPESIVRTELLPVLRTDPGYLDRMGMERVGGTDVLPKIMQRPGPRNAMGRVKFLFPNTHAIYLHDTPGKAVFAREKRALSHGCIRLSEAGRLARHLLRHDTAWTAQRMDAAMHRPTELQVPLKVPVPVVIGYFTAWVDDAGLLHFREDIYGHDARLERELFTPTNGDRAAATTRQASPPK